MRMKYARKLSFFIMWLLDVQLLRGNKRYGPVWGVMINPLEMPINDEARNEAHIVSTGVWLYQYKKRNGKLVMYHKIK